MTEADERRIDVLERQVKALRQQMTVIDHWRDTLSSPLYKRLWWWLLGFRLTTLGTWYRASWNASARKYD